jgi:PleD family two-component response regulator
MGKILFAEDDSAMRAMVTDILGSAGHSVQTVDDGSKALDEVRSETPDLVVLDYRMGNPDGFEVCRQIKSDPRLEHVPVLILTGENDVDDRIEGFAAGASDYLAKPFDARELLARVQALLRLTEQGRGLNPTTGLPGGGAIEREFERRRSRGAPFTLCYLDLDFFKPFNDRFGFPLANAVIEDLGRVLRDLTARKDHFAGHIGGDDFVLICERFAARPLVEEAQARFGQALLRRIPEEVAKAGVYRGRLRSGETGEVPVTRIAAALLHIEPASAPDFTRLGELAANAKDQAKEAAETRIVEVDVAG